RTPRLPRKPPHAGASPAYPQAPLAPPKRLVAVAAPPPTKEVGPRPPRDADGDVITAGREPGLHRARPGLVRLLVIAQPAALTAVIAVALQRRPARRELPLARLGPGCPASRRRGRGALDEAGGGPARPGPGR